MTPQELLAYEMELKVAENEIERLQGLIVNLKLLIAIGKAENEKTDNNHNFGNSSSFVCR